MSVRARARRPRRHAAALTLVVLACAGALPASAAAATYTVDSLGDQGDDDIGASGCATSLVTCTLRAAIQESNFSTGVKDTIKFKAPDFNGELGDTIGLGANFPPITDPVTIDGDGAAPCLTAAAVNGPCVGIERTVAGATLVVENADGVIIEGLAVTGSGTGINVLNSSEGFTARDDWLGVKLNGAAGTNTTGIFLDPNSNDAQIGGAAPMEGNVFANNSFEGLDIQGASTATVWGNYFGVKPDGVTPAANGKDLELTSSFTVEAIGNEIGRDVSAFSAEAPSTTACDGGCNVFASSSLSTAAIDLKGDGVEEPPSRSTTIHGNYIGLDATGAALAAGATSGILVAAADEALIGGSGAGAANHINGGTYGVLAGTGADDLVVDGNLIGLNVAGTATLSPPSTDGVFDSSEGITGFTHTAEITDNRISMSSGVAIEQHSIGALISGNDIGRGAGGENLSGGETGIRLWGSIGASVVESNVIENPTGNGILIENENNEMVGNVIEGAALAGVRIENFLTLPSTGNLIGGDTKGEENAISESGGDAIEVVDEEDDDTQIARNFGDSNGGLFIDLGADGPGNKASGPNDGIQAPTISSATVSGASGAGARPGATVRVFRKATASPGEVESFLGEATADGSGKWSLTYGSPIPGETAIAATQSDVEGTSELVLASTASPPSGGGPTGGGGTGGSGGNGNGGGKKGKGNSADATPPQTTIRKGPKARTHATSARFKFSSSEAGSNFQCKLDRRPFRPCRPGKRYTRLKPGKHVFTVRAIDRAGNVDKSPAKKKFRVLGDR